jgi:hypothetical protein
MHFNYRYFETDGGVWWFGGGTDISKSSQQERIEKICIYLLFVYSPFVLLDFFLFFLNTSPLLRR